MINKKMELFKKIKSIYNLFVYTFLFASYQLFGYNNEHFKKADKYYKQSVFQMKKTKLRRKKALHCKW